MSELLKIFQENMKDLKLWHCYPQLEKIENAVESLVEENEKLIGDIKRYYANDCRLNGLVGRLDKTIEQLTAALDVKQKRIEELESDDKTTMKFYSEMTAEAKRKDDRISELEADIQKKISIHHIVCETNYQRGFEAGKIEGEKLTARTTDEEKGRIYNQAYAKAKYEWKDEATYLKGYKDGTAAVFEIWNRISKKEKE